jgi:hypothetical protein
MGIPVGVNPPKTPVTEGSGDIAPSSLPGIYKMPGPPAPFVPTPLPNIGKSSDNLSCTKTVKIEGKKVANKGTTYKSTGSPDAASKGTGGGVVSSTEEGKTEFTAPGSSNTKMEGKNVQLLSDAMTNDDKDGGATLPGNVQGPASPDAIPDFLCEAFCQALAEHKDKVKKGTVPKKGYHITDRFKELIDKKGIPGVATESSYLMSAQGVPELLTPGVFTQVAGFLTEAVPEVAPKLAGVLGAGVVAEETAGGSVGMMAGVAMAGALAFASKSLADMKSIFGVGTSFLGRVSRPDVTVTKNGQTDVYDAKFEDDTLSPNQKTDFNKIAKANGGKFKQIDCKACGCC